MLKANVNIKNLGTECRKNSCAKKKDSSGFLFYMYINYKSQVSVKIYGKNVSLFKSKMSLKNYQMKLRFPGSLNQNYYFFYFNVFYFMIIFFK